MEKDKLVICRPFYCDECYTKNRVIEGKLFTVYGSKRQSVFIIKSSWHGIRGITPHLIFFDGIVKDNVFELIVSCGIHDCGVSIYEIPDNPGNFDVAIKKARVVHLRKEDWEALKTFNDTGFRID